MTGGAGSLPTPPRQSDAPPRPDDSDAGPRPDDSALGRYQRTIGRQRTVYFSVVAAIVVVLGVVAGVAWSRGEVANTTSDTVSSPPPGLPLTAPSAAPKRVWHTGDRAAIGQPQSGGTVVTYDAHTVRGRDARTGERTWSYSRSNRTVCTAAQVGRTTVAVYRLSGNCDQVTALDSGTGKRKWTRTLDIDGQPLNGEPAFRVVNQGGFYTVAVQSRSVIYAIDPSSGYNRWVYSRYGCAINGSAFGANGVLISQTCSQAVQCAKQKFCGPGRQLLLRNAYDGRDDKSEVNPDKIAWNLIGNRGVPLASDTFVAAGDPSSGVVTQYDEKGGGVTARTRLAPRPTSFAGAEAVGVSDYELIWLAGRTYAVRRSADAQAWSVATEGPPGVVTANPDSVPGVGNARTTVAAGGGVRLLDAGTGRASRSFPIGAQRRGSRVLSLGDGFLVTGTSGTTAYAGS